MDKEDQDFSIQSNAPFVRLEKKVTCKNALSLCLVWKRMGVDMKGLREDGEKRVFQGSTSFTKMHCHCALYDVESGLGVGLSFDMV